MIVIDMIRCGIKYQAGYYDYQEFEFSNNRLQWQDNNCKIMITF